MANTAPPLLEMLDALIAEPSVSAVEPEFDQPNQGVIDRLANWLNDAGFAVEVQPIPGQPGKANLVATLGKGPGGLVLSGHTDTVPVDPELWTSDPFRLDRRDGRLYGLGTADMKSYLALAIEAARDLDPGRLSQPLVILATADEESGMSGAKALAQAAKPLGRQAIIGEPTGMRPVHMHKGVMMEGIRIQGRSGHSSDPSLGVNALDSMSRVLARLQDWRAKLAERYRDDRFQVPQPTLNLGYIHGGDNPNRICGHTELHIDIRPLPGMSLEELRAELAAQVREAVGEDGTQVRLFSLFDGQRPLETAADSALVKAAEDLTGAPAHAVAFGTEGPFLADLGMDVVVWGPGDIEQAHQPDEFLEQARIQPTVDTLRRFIQRLCVEGGHD